MCVAPPWSFDLRVMVVAMALAVTGGGCGGPRGVAAAESSDASTTGASTSGSDGVWSEADATTRGGGEDSTDASPCDEVHQGNLVIGDGIDLQTWAHVREVTGSLVIAQSEPPLVDLAALGCLERVGGSLQVSHTTGLVDLSGLHRLSFVGERLEVFSNADLRSLDGLDALRYVAGISIVDNPALEQLGLRSLQAAGWLSLGQGCTAFDPPVGNPAITTIDGLDSLLSLGSLGLYGNASLVSLDGLHALGERDAHVGWLWAEHNESLSPATVEAAAEALGAGGAACGNLGQDPSACRCPIP